MPPDTDESPRDAVGRPNARSNIALDLILGLAGAVAGGIVGYYVFFAIARQGFYALALPGALIGLGCGALSGRKSVPLGIVSGILGLIVGIYTEWRFAPFIKDRSLSFFLAHVPDLSRVTQVLIVLGGGVAFWFGLGRQGGVWPRKRKNRSSDSQV